MSDEQGRKDSGGRIKKIKKAASPHFSWELRDCHTPQAVFAMTEIGINVKGTVLLTHFVYQELARDFL